MSFSKKRDRIEILAEILELCRAPQTQTYIRRHVSVSYGVLQSCIVYLLLHNWLLEAEDAYAQKKLVTTQKGFAFLEKYAELESLAGIKNKRLYPLSVYGLQAAKVVCR